MAAGPHWAAMALISVVALLGVPFLRPPRRSPGFEPPLRLGWLGVPTIAIGRSVQFGLLGFVARLREQLFESCDLRSDEGCQLLVAELLKVLGAAAPDGQGQVDGVMGRWETPATVQDLDGGSQGNLIRLAAHQADQLPCRF